jgi:hypothetical protein
MYLRPLWFLFQVFRVTSVSGGVLEVQPYSNLVQYNGTINGPF